MLIYQNLRLTGVPDRKKYQKSLMAERKGGPFLPSRLSLLLRCLLLPFIEEGEMTNEGGGGCMRDSPRSPMAKTNGSRFEGNRIINPHSPDSKVNKQTNKQLYLKYRFMRNSPRSPTVKTNGSSREGNRIINPHSRIPKSTNKQTNTAAIHKGR